MRMIKCTSCMKDLDENVRICPYCGFDQEGEPQPANALRRNSILRGKYLIGNVIGQGGFGITYVGFDLALEIKVAVKEYYPSGIASRSGSFSNEIQWGFGENTEQQQSKGIDKFLREAKKLARLDAVPSVVRVRDAFAENGTAYIIMDYVEGVTLKTCLRNEGVMNWNACMKLLLPVMESLSIVHNSGFIHRDISPDNIMICPNGTAMLLDFGAAVEMSAHNGQVSTAVIKHHFSAPEQYMESVPLGTWTDVYAMAATIYACLTGKEVPDALERSFQKSPIVFPDQISLPAHVKSAILRALELDVGARTGSMEEFARQLLSEAGRDEGKGGTQKEQKRQKPGAETAKHRRKTPIRIVAAAAAALLLILLVGAAIWMNQAGMNQADNHEASAETTTETVSLQTKYIDYEDGTVKTYCETSYDEYGREKKNLWYEGDGSLKYWYAYDYDADGNQTMETEYNADDSLKGYTEYTYDADGNKIKSTYYDSEGSVEDWYEYTYDADGNEIKFTSYDPEGSVKSYTEYTYTDSGLCEKETDCDGDGTVEEWTLYEYDSAGNKIKSVSYDADGTIGYWYEYTYDSDGNMLTYIQYKGDELCNTYVYTYDENGRQVSWHHYDENGALTSESTNEYELDADGNLLQMSYYYNGELGSVYEYTVMEILTAAE